MDAGLLALALLCPAAPVEPVGLGAGAELTFLGTVEEAVERPGVRFRRSQNLEIRVLVLEKKDAWLDVAVLTRLRRADDAAAEKAAPPAVRLDLLRVHADGTAHHLHPTGPPPFVLDAKTVARALPPINLDTFTPFEFGMFPPRAPRGAPEKPWTVASADPNRPAEVWQAQGAEAVAGARCAVLVANQQHPNWLKPVGGRTAWHRADAVWVSEADGTARKVHRVVTHRDGTATDPAAWVEVRYELKEQTALIGRTFDRYRRDVETAFAAGADLAPFLADAVRHGPKFFETKGHKLDDYLAAADASSPYREAVVAVRRQVAAAARGESVAAAPLAAPSPPQGWPEPNRPAPDFTAGTFRLSENRGKPVLLVFFKPGGETTDLALAVADALHQKHGPEATIVPLAVWADPGAGAKERARLKLAVPVYDGAQAEAAYGVESVPRFALVDATGAVRWTFTGVGAETGPSARAQLERLLKPASPAGATGTTGPPGSGTAPPRPRP